MTDIQVVTYERHGEKRWHRSRDFNFARSDALVPLGLSEIPKALMTMSVAFVASGEGLVPAGVLGWAADQNLFVGHDGQWLADFIPAAYSTYPFKLGRSAQSEAVLCIDEDAGLVNDDPAGIPFFAVGRKPSPEINELLSLLSRVENDRKKADRALMALIKHALVEPWSVTVQQGESATKTAGLHRVSEKRLNELEPGALAELRDCGGLLLAYCQLLSMQNIGQLATLARRGQPPMPTLAPSPPPAPPVKLNDDNGIISFENL